jgi:hypothetical protein
MKNISLKRGKLFLEFLCGNIQLSYNGVILTGPFGFYSSFFYKDKWYDSRFATWKSLEKKDYNLILYGEWFNLPHRQIWHIHLADNHIFWEIKCENIDASPIHMVQQNVMLKDFYDSWNVVNYASGKFPPYFVNYKGLLWDRMWSMPQVEGQEIVLMASRVEVPLVRWKSPVSDMDCLVSLENSDPAVASRILQVLFVNPEGKQVSTCTLKGMLYFDEKSR